MFSNYICLCLSVFPQLIDIVEVLVKTPIESTISVKGVVCTRPVDQVNPVSIIYAALFCY